MTSSYDIITVRWPRGGYVQWNWQTSKWDHHTGVRPMDVKVIRASAKRIIELANQLPDSKRHDIVIEAATILQLTNGKDVDGSVE